MTSTGSRAGTAQELADLWDHWADVRALLLGPAPVAVEA